MITEDQLEQLCLDWFQRIGYDYVCGYDIAPDGSARERSDYSQIILQGRLLSCLQKLNDHIPTATLEQVLVKKVKASEALTNLVDVFFSNELGSNRGLQTYG